MQTLEEPTETLNRTGSKAPDPKTPADPHPPEAMPPEGTLGLGSGPAAGDFVWGKVRGRQWWPARVLDPSEASEPAKADRGAVLVACFGDESPTWCSPAQLKPFVENFEQMASSGSLKSFRAAVHSAVGEIGKILEAELSCNCLPEGERSAVAKYLGRNSGNISNFSCDDFLGLVKDVAADVSAVSVLESAKLRSWVVALQRGFNVGYKRKAIADLVDKIDLDVPASEVIEGPEVLNGPEILSENSNRGRKKKSMAVLIAQMDSDTVEESVGDEGKGSGKNLDVVEKDNAGGDVKEEKEEDVGSGRRERKKSKYLSPPYTNLSGGLAKSLASPKSSEPKTPKSAKAPCFGSSASIVKCVTDVMSTEDDEKSASAFQVDAVDVAQVLHEFLITATDPFHLKGNRAAKTVRGFFAEFRSSFFSFGAKFNAHTEKVTESTGEGTKVDNKEVDYKSEEDKQTEKKRRRKRKDVISGDAEPMDGKSEEGEKPQGKRGRKKKDVVNNDGEATKDKSEEGKNTEGKRGRKKEDKVNGEGDTQIDSVLKTSEDPETNDEATSKANTLEEGPNGKTPVAPKRQNASGLENGTSGRKRGRKKADAIQNITVDVGCNVVNNGGSGTGQEDTKLEGAANTTAPQKFDIEGSCQTKEASSGRKRKNSKNGPIVDVPVHSGGNHPGEGKSKQKKNNKKSNGNEDPVALLLTFSPDITLPSKEDLVSAFSKYGPVIESETEVVKEPSSAKVLFARSSDAENAFNDKVATLSLPVASYRLRYLTGNLNSCSATPAPVTKPPLPYIRQSLERMISTLSGSELAKVAGTSEALKPETRDSLVDEMQGLLMKVEKMLTGPAAGTSG